MESWRQLRTQVKSLDIVFFRGNDFISSLISKLQKRKLGSGSYTHVGLIVKAEDLPSYRLDPDYLYVLESTFSFGVAGQPDCPDVISKRPFFGVQLRNLDQLIPLYLKGKAEIAIGFTDFKVEDPAKFEQIFQSYYGRYYELNLEGLLASLYPCLRPYRDMKNTFIETTAMLLGKCVPVKKSELPSNWQFCSEMVANVIRELGYLPALFNCENVVPMDLLGYDQDGLPVLVKQLIKIFLN